jgi:hypothetical protein
MKPVFDTTCLRCFGRHELKLPLCLEKLGIHKPSGDQLPHTFSEPLLSHGDEAGTRDAMAKLLVFSGD